MNDGPAPPWVDRLVAIATVLAAAGVVWLCAGITADPRGHGTHVLLGLRPCGWAEQGYPCPTCGITTAAVHLVHLEPLQALRANPFGAMLAFAGLLAAAFALFCLLRGRSLLDAAGRLAYGKALLAGIALLLGSWLYKYLTFVP